MKTIAILSDTAYDISVIEALAPDWEVALGKPEAIREQLMRAEIVAGWGPVISEICAKNDTIKWIQSWSAGVDSYPLAELKRKGILLTNASGVYSIPIAESILGMMLYHARGLHHSFSARKEKRWIRGTFSELHGKTIGILGAGSIGRETAGLAKAFSMKTLGLRRSGLICEGFDEIFPTDKLDMLLARSDYVVNILPLTDETKGIMDARRFSAMKKTACYFSVGRGLTTDQAALAEALSNHRIAFAGLDVTTPEPLPPDSPLWDLPNILITPHISGSTSDWFPRALRLFSENLTDYLKTGKPSRNLVDFERMY
jgi:phosphoglycerate dehydrogenase-like enzyme